MDETSGALAARILLISAAAIVVVVYVRFFSIERKSTPVTSCRYLVTSEDFVSHASSPFELAKPDTRTVSLIV